KGSPSQVNALVRAFPSSLTTWLIRPIAPVGLRARSGRGSLTPNPSQVLPARRGGGKYINLHNTHKDAYRICIANHCAARTSGEKHRPQDSIALCTHRYLSSRSALRSAQFGGKLSVYRSTFLAARLRSLLLNRRQPQFGRMPVLLAQL